MGWRDTVKLNKPFERNVSSRYGAPMGRREEFHPGNMADVSIRLHLQRVPLHDYCYDKGGAYWGGPSNLWCAWGEDAESENQVELYTRAANREEAKANILTQYDLATFYK
jgi:hypothetical protein